MSGEASESEFPQPEFRGWYPWSVVRSGDDKGLDEVGTYLLARFEHGKPARLDPTAKEIFYIGEAHGRTRTLRARLTDFGRSAGFGGKQQSGHYGAWEYPKAFPHDVAAKVTDPRHVYVAICPFPGEPLARATRGVFPGLIEAMSLWRYTTTHGALPRLNNSGGGHALPEAPQFDSELLRALLAGSNRAAADQWLQTIATAMKYSVRKTYPWQEDEASGFERPLGGGLWLQISWDASAAGVRIWVSNKSESWFGTATDEGAATTEADLRARIDRLWKRWHTE